MLILTLRTGAPIAEVGLYEDDRQLGYHSWQAHRELSDTLHQTIQDQLETINKQWTDIEGLVFFEGPGSFTGLRIGAACANALRSSLGVHLVNQSGEHWITDGIHALKADKDQTAMPQYGAPARTTQQKR